MKSTVLKSTLSIIVLLMLSVQLFAATGEVTKSGSNYTAKVDGSTVYSGSRYFDAINAACNGAGTNGYINIKNSGSSGEDGGNIYAIKPLAGQTLEFNGVTVDCNSSGDLIVAIYADRKSGITIRNIKVTGNPRYAFWFRGCSNSTFTNITMDLSNDSPVGLGIRVDASTGSASNLTINGTININGSAGHAIETYSVSGVSIGDVTATNTGGCGVLLNDSENCNVGVVTGYYNCPNAGYATFRVANNNRSTYCEGVYSRNSGRGFFSVTNSSDCTVGWVDIASTYSQCIYIQDSYNTHVTCGTVSDCGASCLISGGSGNSINVAGWGGSACGSSSSNGTVNGTYAIIASHSGKALDTYNWGTSDGTNIVQWGYWGGAAQQFNIAPVDGDWHRITPVISTGQALDVAGISTANGANINTWSYWGGYGQQFRFQSAGSGVWRIINRNSEKCLDVEGNSSNDGANILQWECISGAANQMFELVNMKSAKIATEVEEDAANGGELIIYPNPVINEVTISIPATMENVSTVILYNKLGQKVMQKNNLEVGGNAINISNLPSGMYYAQLINGNEIITEVIIKK